MQPRFLLGCWTLAQHKKKSRMLRRRHLSEKLLTVRKDERVQQWHSRQRYLFCSASTGGKERGICPQHFIKQWQGGLPHSCAVNLSPLLTAACSVPWWSRMRGENFMAPHALAPCSRHVCRLPAVPGFTAAPALPYIFLAFDKAGQKCKDRNWNLLGTEAESSPMKCQAPGFTLSCHDLRQLCELTLRDVLIFPSVVRVVLLWAGWYLLKLCCSFSVPTELFRAVLEL